MKNYAYVYLDVFSVALTLDSLHGFSFTILHYPRNHSYTRSTTVLLVQHADLERRLVRVKYEYTEEIG